MEAKEKPNRKKLIPPAGAPYLPPEWKIEDAGALQALARGEAEPHQQKRALDFIINQLSGYYDLSFRPSGDRDTCFAEGKRFVGQQLVKLVKIDLNKLKRMTDGGYASEQP